jgi:sigma54-dependent transcription regulator
VEGKIFFNTGYNYFRIATIFKMKTEDDYYILGITAQTKPSYVCNFILMKLLFNSINIETNSPIKKTETLKSDNDNKSYISSCFESDNNYITLFDTYF